MNPEKPRNIVVYARNAANDIAVDLGLTHYLVLDDDYHTFEWKFIDENGKLKGKSFKNFDKVIENVLDFLDVSGALTVAMAQGGDYIGGANGRFYWKKISRKAMNSFFCRTDREFKFMGAINEDVNAYVTLGNRGKLFFTITTISLDQVQTQKNKGGLTEAYLECGTYVKSFYTVMLEPSCAIIKEMGTKHRRMHHMIKWKYAVQVDLRMVEMCIGLSYGILSRSELRYTNTDEIRASLNQTFAYITAFRKSVQKGIKDALDAIDALLNMNGTVPVGDWEVKFDWSYGFIESMTQTFNQLTMAEGIGAVAKWEVRQYLTDEDEPTARAAVEQIAEETGANLMREVDNTQTGVV